jgi:acid phosphatase (class A)
MDDSLIGKQDSRRLQYKSSDCAIGPATGAPRSMFASGSLLIVLLLAACASTPSGNKATAAAPEQIPVPEIRPGILAGYLGKDLPDSLLLLPPPPVDDSAAYKNDQVISRASQKLRATPRFTLAARDADLGFPHAASTFACALDMSITQHDTPRLYLLLRRTLTDAGLATYAAKDHYRRIRPFVHFKEATCAPADEEALRKDGSYPSGHAAIGWAWALLLSELAPGRTNALLARGRSYGESRMVCNAHWQSDVLEGRAVAAGVVARLHSDATFKADMEAARAELDALRLKGGKPDGNCAAEAAALAIRIEGVL